MRKKPNHPAHLKRRGDMHETDTHFFLVEQPAPGTPIPAGRHMLRGWVVPKPAHHFTDVRARVGGREIPGVYGFPRADLAAHFTPGRPWLLAEFTVVAEFAPGPAVVQLEALDISGRWLPVGEVTYQVTPAAAPEPLIIAPLRAHEFTRGLSLWLKAGGDRSTELAAEMPWPRAVREAHLPFYGYLDEPAASAPAFYGRLHVLGWLFHESQPLRRAFATTDLVTLQPLEVGGEYTGLRQVFEGKPQANASRVFGFVDVPAQLPAPLCVRIFAELADGSLHLCLAYHCRPTSTEELKAAWPVFSPGQFLSGWRRLRQAWRQRHVPMEEGSGLWKRTWAVWRDYYHQAPPRVAAHAPQRPAPNANAPKPRRLLLISHNLNHEGAPLCLLEVARHLAQQDGLRLLLLTPQDGPLRAAYEKFGTEIRVVDGKVFFQAATPAAVRRAAADLAATLDWTDIDLVVANTIVSFWGLPLARAAGKRVLLYIHESTTPSAFFARAFGRGVLPSAWAAVREADAVTFTARPSQAYYAGLRAGNDFTYTPGWIDVTAIDQYRAAHRREDVRAARNLGPDEMLVLNLGSVCDRKGQHVFVNAVELLWRRHPALAARARFVMVGARENDPYNDFLRAVVTDLGRANLVLVKETGGASDYLHAADLFVCTSYEEAFPRVVAEAMAFSLPIVASAVHGIPDMVEPETEAILVPPGDTEALMQAMVRSLEDLAAARARGARARARVDRDFRTEHVLPLHSALVSGLAAGPR
jgi:glycosyltransferase involved in cell wall biosynthesis